MGVETSAQGSRVTQLNNGFLRMQTRYLERDMRNQQIMMIRTGRMSDVAPDLFPSDGPWQQPVIANMIDIAARDLAEMIAPLPAFNAGATSGMSASEEKRAEKRTKILSAMLHQSDLQTQMYTAADNYITFGWAFSKIEYNYDTMLPVIRLLDPLGCYPVVDRWRRVSELYQTMYVGAELLAELYPELETKLKARYNLNDSPGDTQLLQVVFHHDKHGDTVFLPTGAMGTQQSQLLSFIPNPIGKCLIQAAWRPGPAIRGQFDDVMFVQLAKSRMALLGLEAAHKSVQAPIVVPPDVTNVPLGPDAHLRTSEPQLVRRLPLDLPPNVFAEDAALNQELRQGSRYPQLRDGDAGQAGGHITGRGVQALMEGFDTQVRTAQAILAPWLTKTASLALECDAKMYGNTEKSVRGTANGTPFNFKYKPNKVIQEDYEVDVQYGLMAGLDPSRWLVFGLQARAEKLISRDYLRRQMPADLDVEEEERKIDIEDTREALKVAVQQYATAIPAMAEQGQDPSDALRVITEVVNGRTKGKPIEEILNKALATDEPTPEELMQQEMMPGAAPPTPGGMPPGMAPPMPQPPMDGGGMPLTGDMAADLSMLAGMGSSGQPNLSANVSQEM